jgi:hypothetical protein
MRPFAAPSARHARTVVLALVLGALLLAAPLAFGWSALGHRLVGELAQRHLDPQAQAEVGALLAGEPEPTLAGVATWADELRNSDPPRFKATSKWHYINAKGGGCDFDLKRDCPGGDCVVAAIERQRAILADRSQPREARRDALKFIVHFVGDVHQPMHAGDRPDAGGNGYQISLRTDLEPEAYARNKYANGVMGTNLHSVWDYYILGEQRLTLDQYAQVLDDRPWPPVPSVAPAPPMAWAKESCRLIEARGIYPDAHKMDRSYIDRWRPLAEQRVHHAAYRLATLLNQALEDGAPAQ